MLMMFFQQVKPVVHSRLKVPGRISSITTEVICIRWEINRCSPGLLESEATRERGYSLLGRLTACFTSSTFYIILKCPGHKAMKYVIWSWPVRYIATSLFLYMIIMADWRSKRTRIDTSLNYFSLHIVISTYTCIIIYIYIVYLVNIMAWFQNAHSICVFLICSLKAICLKITILY